MRRFKYSPELQSMMKLAVHFPARHKYDTSKVAPVVVERKINGHKVEAVGTRVERCHGYNGWGETSCIRWKVDGRWVSKSKLLLQFGIEI